MESENLRYADWAIHMKNSMDLYIAGPGERCYNTTELLDCYGIVCSFFIGQSFDLEYCFECFDCRNCFACAGLRKKQHCVFNRQYTEAEYWEIVDRIKYAMLEDGSYGEFLPLQYAFYVYADTYASVHHPLTKETTASLKVVQASYQEPGKYAHTVLAKDLPASIQDVDDGILEQAILCAASDRPFRIVEQELAFYRAHAIPLPTTSPQVRLLERLNRRTPMRLYDRTCNRCGKSISSCYPPTSPLRVYCESCYNSEVA